MNVGFTLDGKQLMLVSSFGVLLYDIEDFGQTPRLLTLRQGQGVFLPQSSTVFSPDGHYLASAGSDGEIHI